MGAWWFGKLNHGILTDCISDPGYCERFSTNNGDGCAECANVNLNGVFRSSTLGTDIFYDDLPGTINDCGLHFTEMKVRSKP